MNREEQTGGEKSSVRVVSVRRTDEGRGALKFSLFAEDNKKAKSFVLRASASVHI